MRVYRIYRKRRRQWAFRGEGARRLGARWNLPGTLVVYTAGTLSLCLLEFYLHFDLGAVEIADLGLECRSAEISADLPILEIKESDLPSDWKAVPWPESTQKLGSERMQESKYPVISVPSVIIPSERNYLINPLHPDFARIRLDRPTPFSMDRRLLSKLEEGRMG